ncbi:hypothetical protein C8R48DRAFT_677233 [Suillus tomentosus]|nr:hypothetical protein C8R48DRAFT_677233 [Suillus tomentosus]
MSPGPIRNVLRRRGRRAQTPFYPSAETRHRPWTSEPHAHDVIEIMSDDEVTGRAASVDVHRELIPTVATEDVIEILSDDEDSQQAGNAMPTFSSDALAAATAELERLRAAIQKVWFSKFLEVISLYVIKVLSERDSFLECAVCKIAFKDLHSHEPCKVIALSQLSNALSSLSGDVQGEEDLSTDWTGYFPV